MNPAVYVVQHRESEVTFLRGGSQEKAVINEKPTTSERIQPALSLCSAVVLQAMRPSNNKC